MALFWFLVVVVDQTSGLWLLKDYYFKNNGLSIYYTSSGFFLTVVLMDLTTVVNYFNSGLCMWLHGGVFVSNSALCI